MRKYMMILTGIVIVILAGFIVFQFNKTSTTSASGYQILSQKDAENLLKNNDNIVVVDVRQPNEFKAGHIAKAINIPLDQVESRYKELDPKKKIIFVCHDGPMGDMAAKFMITKGYKDVANISGGINSWKGRLVKG